MPDYIYLLENRLSPSQQSALRLIREAARDAQMTVFLTGGAVRDLTSGSPVRDLDISVQGNALKLQKSIEKAGGILWGSDSPSQTLFFRFPGGVRAEISSTRRVEYPKPGKPVYHPDNILDDLHRRDFTANAMALSLNEGSYGLLMDPLNGVADIEARHLRLVRNYGFLEEPARLIRATRFVARLGWELDEKTKARFDNAMVENMVESLSPWQAAYELEEIGHEEDALKILKAMEAAGWMKHLFPAWTAAKADVAALEQLREVLIQLQMQGVNPDISAASMELLTAKMTPKELAAMKAIFVRPGFVAEWNNLDAQAKEFAKALTAKQASTPSAIWKLFTSSNPDAVLWLGLTGKATAIQEKYKNFFNVWPEARQKIPYTLMQEMRITPELPGYQDLLQSLFYEFIDGKLQTDEELRAFLEPFSPPAPPPPVTVRRSRAPKKTAEGRGKGKLKDVLPEDGDTEDADEEDVELPQVGPLADDEPVEEDDADNEDERPAKSAMKSAPKPTKVKSSPDKGSGLSVVEKSPSKTVSAEASAAPTSHSGKVAGGKEAIAKDAKVLARVNGNASAHKDTKQTAKPVSTVKPVAHSKPVAPTKAASPKQGSSASKKAVVKPVVSPPAARATRPLAAKHVVKKALPVSGTQKSPIAKNASGAKKALSKNLSRSIKPAAKTAAAKKHSTKKASAQKPIHTKAAVRKPIAAKKAQARPALKKLVVAKSSRKPLARPVTKKKLAVRKKR